MKKILITGLLAFIGCFAISSCVKTTDHTVRAYSCYCNFVYKRGNVTTDTIPATYTVNTTYVGAQAACDQAASNNNPDPGHTLYQSVYCRFE